MITSGSDEAVELFVTTNSKLQVARSDALDFEVFGGIASQLQHFGTQVLKNGSRIHGSSSSNTIVGLYAALQVSVDTANGKLHAK